MTPDEQHAYGVVGIPSQPETDWALLVVDDLTEQERRELAEREFVSNAAHELRTPLTTIIGAVEVLQAGAKEDPVERDRFLGHIEREAGRLARLARAMLTLARAHSRAGAAARRGGRARAAPARGRRRPAARTPASRSTSRSRDGLAVEANRDLLEQALRNLGENAAKHTARGSVVLRAYGDGNTVTIEVEDSGPGISPEVQRHVFDRFYRGERDAHGFGLGLAIVRESVRTLGGRIELDSVAGRGHRLPDPARAGAGAGGGAGVTRSDGERILLVDDDAGVRDVVAFTLRREGFEVDEERDGRVGARVGPLGPVRARHPRRDAARDLRRRGLPRAAGGERRPDPDAHGARRGVRPRARARARRRRLRDEAVLERRAAQPRARDPAAPRARPRDRRARPCGSSAASRSTSAGTRCSSTASAST